MKRTPSTDRADVEARISGPQWCAEDEAERADAWLADWVRVGRTRDDEVDS